MLHHALRFRPLHLLDEIRFSEVPARHACTLLLLIILWEPQQPERAHPVLRGHAGRVAQAIGACLVGGRDRDAAARDGDACAVACILAQAQPVPPTVARPVFAAIPVLESQRAAE